jgi:hypothetical protein
MSDKREVFTVLELTTGEGTSWVKKNETDAIAAVNLAPVVAGKKGSGFSLLPVAAAGSAATDAQPTLPVLDSAGNMRFINSRDEGDSITGVDALPGLVAKDVSDQFAYLKLNADGELLVSTQSAGTPLKGNATVACVVGTETEILAIPLTVSADYERVDVTLSNTFTTLWKVYNVEDYNGTPTETEIAQAITGPGQFTFTKMWEDLNFTAGSTGDQMLVIKAKQLIGAASDGHATATVYEKA